MGSLTMRIAVLLWVVVLASARLAAAQGNASTSLGARAMAIAGEAGMTVPEAAWVQAAQDAGQKPEPAPVQPAPPSQEEIQSLGTFFKEFLTQWIIEQDIDKAVAHIDAGGDYQKAMRELFEIKDDKFDFETWVRKVLVMWLYEDHGEAGALGHGDPRHAEYGKLASKPSDIANRGQWKKLSEAIGTPMINPTGPGAYIIGLQFHHAKRDMLLFEVKKVGDGWKITMFIWIAG